MLTIFLVGVLLHLAMLRILMGGERGDGSKSFSFLNNYGKGGETTITAAQPAPQPSTADAINAWVQSMPQVFQTQMEFAPKEAAQQVALTQQYALPLAQAYQQANDVLNPGTSQLQENMSNQALQGMNATSMPDWMANQYRDEMKAQLGTNVASPIGADYVSRGMQQQLFNQQKYYRDLGLSLAQRQPLTQAQTPATTNYASTFNPQSAMNYQANTYGTYAQAARPFAFQNQPMSLGFLGNWG